MATWIPNQPVYFGTEAQCSSDELSISQLVDNTDSAQVQFNIAPCEGAVDVIPDTTFNVSSDWVLSDNWVVAYNQLCLSGSSHLGSTVMTGTGGITPLSIFTYNNYYEITIVVDSISVGGEIDVMFGNDVIGTLTSVGTFTFYGYALNTYLAYYYPLVFVTAVAGTNICMSSVSSKEILQDFVVAVYNSDGVFQTSFDYANQPSYFQFVEDTVTILVFWSEIGIQDGCYYLCLLDPCVNTNGQNLPAVINNCTFTQSLSGWSIAGFGSAWRYGSNSAVGDSAGASKTLTQSGVFASYTNSYSITVIVTAYSGTGVDVYFGTNLVGTITSTGTWIISGYAIGNSILKFTILNTTTITIDSACPTVIDPSNYVCDFTSNNFSIADYITNGCTHLINACNNENGLGFTFGTSTFTPRLRLESKLRQAKYPAERLVQADSLGEKNVYYFTGRKAKYFCVDLQHEYIHDFLNLLRGFDNWYIDGVLYFVEDDEYTVEYSNLSDNIGKSKMLVSTRVQNVKNTNCSSTINNCTLA